MVTRDETGKGMNENEFCRQATLRICGNLEIEEALYSLLKFLSDFMPVDTILLEYYDYDYNAMRSVAQASENEYKKLDILTPLSKDARELASQGPAGQNVYLIEDPQAFPVSREMLRFFKTQSTSMALIVLKANEQRKGYLILISKGEKKFCEADLKLLDLLKDPLSIAMSNTLKHREIRYENEIKRSPICIELTEGAKKIRLCSYGNISLIIGAQLKNLITYIHIGKRLGGKERKNPLISVF